MRPEPRLEIGWIAEDLRLEFPELRLVSTVVDGGTGRTPEEVKDRLRVLSNRYTGQKAIALRQQPIPWAYRVFFRQVGIDPDEHRTPVEAYALERMRAGGFLSRDLLEDALTIATVETGVPIVAFDDERLDGPLGLRPAHPGEKLGTQELANELPEGRLVVADAERVVGVLFGLLAKSHLVSDATTTMRLFSVRAPSVPEIHVEEALWTCVECLTAADRG